VKTDGGQIAELKKTTEALARQQRALIEKGLMRPIEIAESTIISTVEPK